VRNTFLIVIAAGVVLAFGINMATYQVDFNERAVVATFGSVSEEGGVVEQPGLKLKWPAPIQTVTVYDSRSRVLEVVGLQVPTADDASLVVDAFLTWRVSDPRAFYSRFNSGSDDPEGQYEAANELLQGRLRQSIDEVSAFTLSELFTTAASGSALPALEERIRERVTRLVADEAGGSAGVEVGTVGVSRLVFPEAVSEQVIARMQAFRQSDAERASREGEAAAATLTEEARADSQAITDFARAEAEAIRARGEEEAAPYYRVMSDYPELARFLKQTELLRSDGLGRGMTLVLEYGSLATELFDGEYLSRLQRLPSPPAPDPADILAGGGGVSGDGEGGGGDE
jgi:membrane protease subunit HflC